MNLKGLDEILRLESEGEKKFKYNNRIIKNINESDNKLVSSFKVSKSHYFKHGNIHISRHDRYSEMQLHNHEFIEINYMYSGQCVQVINNEKIVLEEGDICLLDKNIKHSIEALQENDILINILLKSETVNTEILQKMATARSIVTEFLLYASQEWNSHNQFIIFKSRKNKKIQDLIKNILLEYYSESIYSMEIIQLTLPLLFIELVRNYNEEAYWYSENRNTVIIDALRIIENKYKQLTLGDLANELGFNKNYLGNLLKKETGETFSNLILKQRLINAHQLVINTNYPIEEIAYKVGLKSTSYFFKIFKDKFKESPGEIRERNKNCK